MFIIWNQHFLWHINFIFWSFFSAKNYKSWCFFSIIHISIKFLVPMGIIKCNLKRKTSFGYSRRNFLFCYLRRIVARVCIGKITLTHHLSRFEFCVSFIIFTNYISSKTWYVRILYWKKYKCSGHTPMWKAH